MSVYPDDFRDMRVPEEVPSHQRSIADQHYLVMRDFDAIDEPRTREPDHPAFQIHTLEVGHFSDRQQAEVFEAEFREVQSRGQLDAPALATSVAQLEGLSGEWEERQGDDLVTFMNDRKPVVVEPEDWHPHRSQVEEEISDPTVSTQNDIDF